MDEVDCEIVVAREQVGFRRPPQDADVQAPLRGGASPGGARAPARADRAGEVECGVDGRSTWTAVAGLALAGFVSLLLVARVARARASAAAENPFAYFLQGLRRESARILGTARKTARWARECHVLYSLKRARYCVSIF